MSAVRSLWIRFRVADVDDSNKILAVPPSTTLAACAYPLYLANKREGQVNRSPARTRLKLAFTIPSGASDDQSKSLLLRFHSRIV